MATRAVKSTTVAIVGAGTQGRRLAYMWSSTGNNVHLIDGLQSQLQDSVRTVEMLRAQRDDKGILGKIKTFSPVSLESALTDAWLVVECVPERLALKQEVLTQLDTAASKTTIVASNSSSYACGELIVGLKLRHPSRILSAHTYWPPETPAIEIMGHEHTEPLLVEKMLIESAKHGFTPFHVKTPSMGYIYNRIWAAIKREALLTAAEGAATPKEIDSIFKSVLKTNKGPFELMDVVGLDVVLDIERHYAAKRRDIPSEPQGYLLEFLEKGHLGVKSGQGFYNWDSLHVSTD